MVPAAENHEADLLVLEGIALTTAPDGSPHLAPMGPMVDRDLRSFRLRPYHTSQTYQNLKRTRALVFHVVDDVTLLARAAVGEIDTPPPLVPTPSGGGWILADCCRWFELRVDHIDDSRERIEIQCSVADQGTRRDFFGWNRAKHAVLEAAILATRIGILAPAEIREQLDRLQTPVTKTAGRQESEAMKFLKGYIEERLARLEYEH